MANGYLNAKFETIPGNEVNTPTLSTKEIYFPVITTTPELAPTPMARDDELVGTDEPRSLLRDTFDPTWDYSSRLYPDLMAFFLKAQLGAPTTTAGNGSTTKDPDEVVIPTGAYKHVWTTPPTGVTPQTIQGIFAYKDQTFFLKQKGMATEKLSITSPVTGGAMIAANGSALWQQRTTDPSLSPTIQAAAIRPFTRTNLIVTWDTGSASDPMEFSMDLENPIETVRSLGVNSSFPDIMERGDGLFAVTGSIAFRTISATDYDALKNATGFAVTSKWVQGAEDSLITGSYPYKAYVKMTNCQYVSGSVDALSNTRHHGATFNWKATNAGEAAATITIVNSTSSYA